MQHQACNFIKKETLAQVLCCEFYKIIKNTFFTEHLRMTAFRKASNEFGWYRVRFTLILSKREFSITIIRIMVSVQKQPTEVSC